MQRIARGKSVAIFGKVVNEFIASPKVNKGCMLFFALKYRYLAINLSLWGFDACELFFSKVVGMLQNERSYDGCDLVE